MCTLCLGSMTAEPDGGAEIWSSRLHLHQCIQKLLGKSGQLRGVRHSMTQIFMPIRWKDGDLLRRESTLQRELEGSIVRKLHGKSRSRTLAISVHHPTLQQMAPRQLLSADGTFGACLMPGIRSFEKLQARPAGRISPAISIFSKRQSPCIFLSIQAMVAFRPAFHVLQD